MSIKIIYSLNKKTPQGAGPEGNVAQIMTTLAKGDQVTIVFTSSMTGLVKRAMSAV